MNLYKVKILIEEMDAPIKEIEDMIECLDENEAELIMMYKYQDILRECHWNISVEITAFSQIDKI